MTITPPINQRPVGTYGPFHDGNGGAFVTSSPMCFNGFGTLTVAQASINLSTLAVGPNSPAFPTGIFTMTVINQGPGNVYYGPLGGTVTTADGLKIPPGASYTVNLNGATTSPTVIADSSGTTVQAQW